MIKKIVYLPFIVAVIFSMVDITVSAQTNERRAFNRADFGVKRNAFITSEMGLTSEETKNFIPLENEFKIKLFEIGRDCRRLTRESQNNKKISDAEYTKMIECYIDTRLKEAQIEKEYYEKFKKILTPEKIYKYQQADLKFSREYVIVRRSNENRNNDNNRNNNRNNNNNRSRR